MNETPLTPSTDNENDRPVYCGMDVARLSLAEIWRICSPNLLGVGYVLMSKLLRRPVRSKIGIAYDSLSFVAVGELPRHVVTALGAICYDCEKLGFQNRFAHSISAIGNGDNCAITASRGDGITAIHAVYVRIGESEETIAVFVSYLERRNHLEHHQREKTAEYAAGD